MKSLVNSMKGNDNKQIAMFTADEITKILDFENSIDVKDIDVNAGITSFEIHLINMISRFDKDYNSNFTYGTSNFVITIEGTIGEI